MPATFESFVLSWLATVAVVRFKGSGYAEYAGICRNHLLPAFGDVPIDGVTAHSLQTYITEKIAEGLSPRTVGNHIQVLSRILEYAVKCGVVVRNVAKDVVLPRQERREMKFLTAEGVNRLVEATRPSWRLLIAMAALTGMRKGELLALTFRDIDLEAGTISVTKSMRNGLISSPKTSVTAVVPLPESLSKLIAQRRGQVSDPDGLVFCRSDGSPLPDGLPNRILAESLKRAGLPPMRFHDLRHSWAVMHLQAGTDIKTLQQLGRWKSADSLLSVYSHTTCSAQRAAVATVDAVIAVQNEDGQPRG